ncbi:MAG: tRNA threonylcarbamoyladenosine dehydratase [Ruminococcaceae bacterium]|nr:tRNA threonylcarbamoyladenosine dehydratase [Oscillospiraceae bacterium]
MSIDILTDERTIRAKALLGDRAMEKLANAHVAVFGVGGVGSWCAEALARSGVGKITLIDDDTVSESNINRQCCALSSTLQMPKVYAMGNRIRDISDRVIVKEHILRYDASTKISSLSSDISFIADCIDTVTSKISLIKEAKEQSIPIISALGAGNKKDAEQLKIANLKDTSHCPLARVLRRELRREGIESLPVVYSSEPPIASMSDETPPEGRRSVPGSLVWVTATAGLLMSQYIISSLIETEK